MYCIALSCLLLIAPKLPLSGPFPSSSLSSLELTELPSAVKALLPLYPAAMNELGSLLISANETLSLCGEQLYATFANEGLSSRALSGPAKAIDLGLLPLPLATAASLSEDGGTERRVDVGPTVPPTPAAVVAIPEDVTDAKDAAEVSLVALGFFCKRLRLFVCW